MRARAPASSANLGPGFDTLAVALGLYVEVEVGREAQAAPGSVRRPGARPGLTVSSYGEGSDIPADSSHLAVRVVAEVLGQDPPPVAITVRSDIPVGRGLGSSAALAVAAAGAAGADRETAFALAAGFDGHPENAAASAFGGLVAAVGLDAGPAWEPFPLDPALAFVVLVPDRPLPTAEARAALPPVVDHAAAAFNIGRTTLLLAGLAHAGRLRAEATADRLHQDARAPLFPEAPRLLAGLVEAGARAASWSGAGPSLLALCLAADAERVRRAGEGLLVAEGVPGRALTLPADLEGLVVRP
jgi:homoserine kinase